MKPHFFFLGGGGGGGGGTIFTCTYTIVYLVLAPACPQQPFQGGEGGEIVANVPPPSMKPYKCIHVHDTMTKLHRLCTWKKQRRSDMILVLER